MLAAVALAAAGVRWTFLATELTAVLATAGTAVPLLWLALRGPLARLRKDTAARDAELSAARKRLRLLSAVLEHEPTAVVLYGDLGRVVFGNAASRELFAEGVALDGMNFLELLGAAPQPLRDAVLAGGDAVFTVEQGSAHEAFRLARRHVELDSEPHTLLLVERLTRELSRQEAAGYKRLIRLLCHELNNSLAPVTSLIHTARVIVQSPARIDRLGVVLDTIEGRATHLRTFIDGYARFARLPAPRPSAVPWSTFVARIAALYPAVSIAPAPPGNGWLDAAQLEQAVINLLKNALEAGGADGAVELEIHAAPHDGARIVVSDRGSGMSPEVMAQALLPFFSTKEGGSGLGLPLCNEIAESHGGSLGLAPREGGGLRVTLTLPGHAPPASIASTARLTLTRH